MSSNFGTRAKREAWEAKSWLRRNREEKPCEAGLKNLTNFECIAMAGIIEENRSASFLVNEARSSRTKKNRSDELTFGKLRILPFLPCTSVLLWILTYLAGQSSSDSTTFSFNPDQSPGQSIFSLAPSSFSFPDHRIPLLFFKRRLLDIFFPQA